MVFIRVDLKELKRKGFNFFSNSQIVLNLSMLSEHVMHYLIKLLHDLLLWLFKILLTLLHK